MLAAPKRVTLSLPKGGAVNYFVADFEKKKETSVERLRVRWSWSTDGTWVAPDYARFAFMKSSELYKLYIVTHTPEHDGKPCDDPPTIKDFLLAAFRDYAQAFKIRNAEFGMQN
jgi:hypothetical protein